MSTDDASPVQMREMAARARDVHRGRLAQAADVALICRRPVLAYWLIAVVLELLLIPLLLVIGADATIERGLARRPFRKRSRR